MFESLLKTLILFVQPSPTQLPDVINVQINFQSAAAADIMKEQVLNGKHGSTDGSQRRRSVFKKG